MTDLDRLIEAVEAGTVISINAKDVCLSLGWSFPDMRVRHILAAEVGSLDAARALHEALLPGCCYSIDKENGGYSVHIWMVLETVSMGFSEQSDANAWLIAVLKAYRAQQQE